MSAGWEVHRAFLKQTGSLNSWQRDIARPSAESSYLVFAISLALAAPLLRFAQVESGCVHFWGRSAQLIEAVAATVFGLTSSWRGAMGAISAEGYNALPLILSDLGKLDANPRVAAHQVERLVNSIIGGTPKACSSRIAYSVTPVVHDRRLLMISTGELSLADHATSKNVASLDEAHIVDIPLPRGERGVFGRAAYPTDRSERERHAHLQRTSAACQGTAGMAFLRAVVRDVGRNEAKLRERLARRMDWFLDHVSADRDDPYETLFAKRFPLTYAAGTLGIDYRVLPWRRDLLRRCVRRCYWRALDRRSGPGAAIRAAADDIIRRLQCVSDIADLTDPDRFNAKVAEGASVLLVPHSDGSTLTAVRPEVFRSLVGPNVSAQSVAAELERRGLLIPRPNGRRTRQVRLPGGAGRRDYYCPRGDIVDLDW